MMERLRGLKGSSPNTLGVILVIVGLLMFVVVFVAAFPVLSDPVGAYDEWFPETEEPTATDTTVAEGPEGPTAIFRYVAEATMIEPPEGVEEEPTFTYRVDFEDRTELGDAEIVRWEWDFGDGAESNRQFVSHTYEGPGAYEVRLAIEDENGEIAEVVGEIEIPEDGTNSGRIEGDSFDLSGIEAAVEDAVGALEDSVDETLGTVRDTSRNMGVVTLFALAAIATTIVAWRVTKSGVMLLRPQPLSLRVKSADMHVDIGKEPLLDVIEEKTDQHPELIDA